MIARLGDPCRELCSARHARIGLEGDLGDDVRPGDVEAARTEAGVGLPVGRDRDGRQVGTAELVDLDTRAFVVDTRPALELDLSGDRDVHGGAGGSPDVACEDERCAAGELESGDLRSSRRQVTRQGHGTSDVLQMRPHVERPDAQQVLKRDRSSEHPHHLGLQREGVERHDLRQAYVDEPVELRAHVGLMVLPAYVDPGLGQPCEVTLRVRVLRPDDLVVRLGAAGEPRLDPREVAHDVARAPAGALGRCVPLLPSEAFAELAHRVQRPLPGIEQGREVVGLRGEFTHEPRLAPPTPDPADTWWRMAA